jgi:hypothetical protein
LRDSHTTHPSPAELAMAAVPAKAAYRQPIRLQQIARMPNSWARMRR